MSDWQTREYPTAANFSDLIGKTLVEVKGAETYSDEIVFVTEDGETYKQYHSQDCCESVSVEDIDGDLSDLLGSPITLAEESTSTEYQPHQPKSDWDDSFTWTFYRIGTAKGMVFIRWYGSSNGYYGEEVSFNKQPKEKQS